MAPEVDLEMELTQVDQAQIGSLSVSPVIPSSSSGLALIEQQVRQQNKLPEQHMAYAAHSIGDRDAYIQGLADREAMTETEDRIDVDDEEAHRRRHNVAFSSNVSRIPYPISTAAWIVILVGSMERMAFYGGSTPFQNYIQRTLAHMRALIGLDV